MLVYTKYERVWGQDCGGHGIGAGDIVCMWTQQELQRITVCFFPGKWWIFVLLTEMENFAEKSSRKEQENCSGHVKFEISIRDPSKTVG